MTNFIINRANYWLSEEHPNLYLSKKDDLTFRMQYLHFSRIISSRDFNADYKEWIKDLKEEDYVYYSFSEPEKSEIYKIKTGEYPFNRFKEKYIREQLMNFFLDKNFIIEPFPKGNDLSIYEKISDFNNEWSIYRRYDLLVRANRKEIAFNVGSENTLISNNPQEFQSTEKIRIIDTKDNFIKPLGGREDIDNCRIIANRLKREQLGIIHEPRKFNYKNLFNQLTNFYNNQLLSIDTINFKIEAGGLKNVDPIYLNKVNLNENLMLFGKEKTDINAVTGMRDYGIYRSSPKATEVKFIFVYENRGDANQLHIPINLTPFRQF
ncbi:hypothetical protein ACFSNA_07815 [Pedobacter mendelii]|uniref:hypothetical protein n=1 Tax=Pedobacter mendelii TaxID=1908240 RepID=UPI003610F61A